MNDTNHIPAELLKCPDCNGSISPQLICGSCGRRFNTNENYINLLPSKLSQNKINENLIFSDGSDDNVKYIGHPWRKIIGRLEIERFDREIVHLLPEGNFLELAGESCWATAIYKATHPNSYAIASDVAENALLKLAVPLSKMFPNTIDLFAAVDAEKLPFQDESLDCIFIESAMHHFPNPVSTLKEIKRVLKERGIFIAVDHCVPGHFRFLFTETAHQRENAYGIQEDLVSYAQWIKYFSAADMPLESIKVYTNPTYQRNPWFSIAGRFISKLPVSMVKNVFPVGLYVEYIKQ